MLRRDQALTHLLKALQATRQSQADAVERHATAVSMIIAEDPDTAAQLIETMASMVAYVVKTDPDGDASEAFAKLERMTGSRDLRRLLDALGDAVDAGGKSSVTARAAAVTVAAGEGVLEALAALGYWLVVGFAMVGEVEEGITTFVRFAVESGMIDLVQVTSDG